MTIKYKNKCEKCDESGGKITMQDDTSKTQPSQQENGCLNIIIGLITIFVLFSFFKCSAPKSTTTQATNQATTQATTQVTTQNIAETKKDVIKEYSDDSEVIEDLKIFINNNFDDTESEIAKYDGCYNITLTNKNYTNFDTCQIAYAVFMANIQKNESLWNVINATEITFTNGVIKYVATPSVKDIKQDDGHFAGHTKWWDNKSSQNNSPLTNSLEKTIKNAENKSVYKLTDSDKEKIKSLIKSEYLNNSTYTWTSVDFEICFDGTYDVQLQLCSNDFKNVGYCKEYFMDFANKVIDLGFQSNISSMSAMCVTNYAQESHFICLNNDFNLIDGKITIDMVDVVF